MKKLIKITSITICSIIGAILLTAAVTFIFFPDQMGKAGAGLSRIMGSEIDTVYVDELKAVRGDIVDCGDRIIATGGCERRYPYGDLARQIIGSVPQPGDSVKMGIEGAFNRGLSGEDGYHIVRRNISTGKARFVRKVRAKDGATVPITIDMEMQSCADSILRFKLREVSGVMSACLIMASTNSGAVRSMVNLLRPEHEDGDFIEAHNMAIEDVYAPGMMAAPASAIAARRCNPSVDLGRLRLDSPEELIEISLNDDIYGYCDTLRTLIEGRYSDRHFEIKGLANPKIFGGDWRMLSCGLCVGAPALTWLRLYTAIARGGDGIALRLVGIIVDEDNTILNEGLFLGSDSYIFCTKEEADVMTASMKRSLEGSTLSGARFPVAGLYGDSSEYGVTQSSFAGFFPADDPAFSIICRVNASSEADSDRVKELITEAVYEIVGSDVIADRVRLTKEE